MKPFKPIEKLEVYRRLSDGNEVIVGHLVQNTSAIYFQYEESYYISHLLEESHSMFNKIFRIR